MKQKQQPRLFHNFHIVIIRYTLIQQQITMSPQRNAQFFSHDFEEEAVAHCNSKLSKTLPHCSFSDMEQPTFLEFEGKELDGFGYILDDSVVSRADGIVLLKFPGGQCTNPPPKHE